MIDDFPATLEDIDLYNNELEECPDLHQNIVSVDLMSNRLTKMMDFHESIDNLDLRENHGLAIPKAMMKKIDFVNLHGEKVMLGDENDDNDFAHNFASGFPGMLGQNNFGGGRFGRGGLHGGNRGMGMYSGMYGGRNNFMAQIAQQRKEMALRRQRMLSGLGKQIEHKNSYVL